MAKQFPEVVLKRPLIICKNFSKSAILEPQSDNESESQSDEFFRGFSDSADFEPRRRDQSRSGSTTDESESQSDFMANQSGSQSSDESESHANNDFLTSSFGSGSESSKGQMITEQICGVLQFSKKATKYCQDFRPCFKIKKIKAIFYTKL